jgi:hypothetical protein
MSIPESDWKRFKQVKAVALERFCEGVLSECQEVIEDRGQSAHERYLQLFRLTRERDKELAAAFDHHSRSKALTQLIAMRRLGVITNEELAGFSSETRGRLEGAVQEF